MSIAGAPLAMRAISGSGVSADKVRKVPNKRQAIARPDIKARPELR